MITSDDNDITPITEQELRELKEYVRRMWAESGQIEFSPSKEKENGSSK